MSARGIRAGRAYVEIGTYLKPLSRGLKKAQFQLRAFSAQAISIGRGMASVGSAVLGALLLPTSIASRMQSTEVQLGTLLGSMDKAKTLMGELQQFSAGTPFQFDGIAESARMLVAFGSAQGDVLTELKQLGDVSAGVDAPLRDMAELYGKARVAGTLYAEDINQLVGRGVPIIGEFAKQLGVAESEVKKMASKGQIQFKHLQVALRDLTSNGGKFEGMMEKMSGTAAGKFSTAMDNLKLALLPIGNALLPMVSAGLDMVTKAFQWGAKAIEPYARYVPILAVAAAGVVAFGAALLGVGVAVQIGLFAVSTITTIFGGFMTVLLAVSTILVSGVGLAFAFLVSPIGLIAAGLIGLGAIFFDFGGTANSVIQWLSDSFGFLFERARETFGAIASALQRGDITAAAEILWISLKAAWKTGTNALTKIWLDFKHGAIGVWFGIENAVMKGIAALAAGWKRFQLSLSTNGKKIGESLFYHFERANIKAQELAGHITESEANGRRQVLEESNRAGNAAIERSDQADLARIDREMFSQFAKLDQDRAALDAANAAQYTDAQNAVASELAAAQKAYSEIIAKEKERSTATPPAKPEKPKPNDPQIENEVASQIARSKKAEISFGSFNASALFGFGTNSVAERTAKANEATAKNAKIIAINTRRMAQGPVYT